MQQLSVVAAQASGSALIRRPSEERLNDAEFSILTKLTTQMVTAYPHQELGDSLEMFLRGFEILTVRHGLPRVKEALQELLVTPGRKFFPHPSELAEVLTDMQTKERQQFLRDHPFTPCGQCEDGMVFVDAEGKPWDWRKGGYRAAKECDCKVAWRNQTKAFTGNDGKAKAAGE
jgi:hypothetical protein